MNTPSVISGNGESRIVVVDGAVLSPARSQSLWNHSPDGFNWGYHGSGPAQLALALALLFVPEDKALRCYQEFKRDYIATLPGGENFKLDGRVVKAWFDNR